PVLRAPSGNGSFTGGSDAFVSRIDTTATTQTANTHFSFFLGGGGQDNGTGIAVDSLGGIYVAASTTSGDFPTTARAFQSALSGPSDAFITKFGPLPNLSMTASAN